MVSCPTVFIMPCTDLLIISIISQPNSSHRSTHVNKCIPDCRGTMFWLKSGAMHSAQSTCTLLGRLYSWTDSKFRIRTHFYGSLYQDWLSVMWTSTFSCFVDNHGFCFLRKSWCPNDLTSSGQHVLLKSGLQDSLSYKLLKRCVTLWWRFVHPVPLIVTHKTQCLNSK